MPREKRTRWFMDSLWREKNWASLTTTVAVLILAFLCKGMRSQVDERFTLRAPASVSVQQGLCVHIPCSFTYWGQPRIPHKQLYAYWFKHKKGTMQYLYYEGSMPGRLVATNDEGQSIDRSARGRFRLTGDPAHGDCSFSINDATFEDAEHYYFRIHGGGTLKFSYWTLYTKSQVVVTTLVEKPEIRKSSELILGKPVTISCQAPGSCSGTKPQISWTPSHIGQIDPWQHSQSNGSKTYGSNITITPSQDNEGQVLTCRVYYSAVRKTVENSIRVDAVYPPKMVHIAANVTSDGHLGSSSLNIEGDSDSVVAWEGTAVRLLCQADSRPDPLLSWTKGNKTLSDSKQAKEHILLLPKIRPEDAGLYRCQAENLVGSGEKAVRVIVQYPPRTVQLSVSQTHKWEPERAQDPPWAVDNGSQLMAREGNALRLFCKADSHPPVEVSWVKGSRTVKPWSPSPDNWLELTQVTVEDKGEYTCRARNTLGSAQGIVQLDIAYAPKLVPKSNSTCWHEKNGFLCTCTLNSWPLPQIQWQVKGETLSGNSSRESLNVTSWLRRRMATSNLSFTGRLEEAHSVICFGNSSVGDFHSGILSDLFGSENKGIVFLLGLYLTKALLSFFFFFFAFRFLNQKKRPVRKSRLTTADVKDGA